MPEEAAAAAAADAEDDMIMGFSSEEYRRLRGLRGRGVPSTRAWAGRDPRA
jgi:hypothetical protein